MAPLDQRGSDVVDAGECWRLLALAAHTRKVGHLGISRDGAPHVIPVNFSVHDQMILLRLGPGFAAYHLDGIPVAFEIDHAEPYSKRGWSVVARGTARTLTYDEVARLGRNLPCPIVMKPGMRVFSIRPDDITGRSIRQGHGATGEPPSSWWPGWVAEPASEPVTAKASPDLSDKRDSPPHNEPAPFLVRHDRETPGQTSSPNPRRAVVAITAGPRMEDGDCERVGRLGPSSLGTHGAVRQNEVMNPPSSAATQAEHAIDTPTPVSPAEQRSASVRPSDLARRVTIRRNELGMSLEELARRAGIDPRYLRYFEQSPDAHLSAGAMLLMAVALDTTPMELQGGDMDRPLGHGRAGPHPVLDTLTLEQCEAHLAAGGVGRILMVTERGPVAVPVNFEFTDGEIVFSTDEVKAKWVETEHFVGFEVDRVDEAMSEGWSVLVTGRGRRITDDDEYQRLASLDLEAWAGGDRHTLVAIAADRVTGRVIIHQSVPDLD